MNSLWCERVSAGQSLVQHRCAKSPVFRSMQYDRCETKQNVTGCAIHDCTCTIVHMCTYTHMWNVDAISSGSNQEHVLTALFICRAIPAFFYRLQNSYSY